ncbi:hypothetical protein ACHAXR_006532 [Thalassiosira sp. AJA248-18]
MAANGTSNTGGGSPSKRKKEKSSSSNAPTPTNNPDATTTNNVRARGRSSAPSTNASSKTYLLFLATCIFVTMTGNFLHHRIGDPHNIHRHAMQRFEMEHLGGRQKVAHEEKKKPYKLLKGVSFGALPAETAAGAAAAAGGLRPAERGGAGDGSESMEHEWKEEPMHDLAGLSCADHGGPSDELAVGEMVYWKDIPSDAAFKSPIGNDVGGRKKYLTFEPDGGGFNNARMSMETIIVMSHAMGRTLVLPPSQGIYLLRKDRDKQRVHFSFEDFYHMEQVGYEHEGLDIISMEEFLKAEAMTGNLRNKTSGVVVYPPNNRTNWDGMDAKPLKEYLRDVTLTPLDWDPGRCLAAFPSDDGPQHFEELNGMLAEIKKGGFPNWNKFTDNPVDVDASPVDRLREAVSKGTKKLCIYDQEMQSAPVVHFMCYHKMRVRMLTHFYAFLFFEDWRHDLWSKRFVRDHLRYSDVIQCAAARVVAAVRKRARDRGKNKNPNGEFDSFHIRRGDFQYKNTRLEADEIYNHSRAEIPDGSTVFVATDHQGKPFFKPLAKHYDLVFLNDFKEELKDVNTNFFGMIDQLVASRGRVFFGCYHSTFSGFIFRIRGYHAQKEKLDGWEQGKIHNSFYYTGEKEKYSYEHYLPVHSPIYSREFPVSWRNIDQGLDLVDVAAAKEVVELEQHI